MNRSTEQHLQALKNDGFVLLPGVLDRAQVKLLRQAIEVLQAFHWDYRGGLIEHTSACSTATRCGWRFLTCLG